MRVGFVGLGKLGLPVALAVESKGHEVSGIDVSQEVIGHINGRHIPYREVGAQELLEKSKLELKGLEDLVNWSEILFVCVQTPHDPMYEGHLPLPKSRKDFEYSYLVRSLSDISLHVDAGGKDKVVVVISTVLPGTVEREIKPVLCERVKLCYNPFFIAMGTAVRDFLDPEFVLFGVDDRGAADVARSFYETITDAPFYETSVVNAELIKVAYNTFIGMKIVFANTLMEICDQIGGDVDAVTRALSLGTRRIISPSYMTGGMGDGGGCHPRDNIALSWLARELRLSHDIFGDIMEAREDQTDYLVSLTVAELEDSNFDHVRILGKAFKAGTNLTTGSPAVLYSHLLANTGVSVYMWDPEVDGGDPDLGRGLYFIATRHECFQRYKFEPGSVVIDPWRYIPEQHGVKLVRVGAP